MIRTRDLFLFAVALVFLFGAITFTIAHDRSGMVGGVTERLAFADDDTMGEIGVASSSALDRQQNLAVLRDKLARGEGKISQGEPVFTSVDTPKIVEGDTEIVLDLDTSVTRIEQYCSVVLSASEVIQNWPLTTAEIQVADGYRKVVGTETVEEVVGSTTIPIETQVEKLRLPLTPVATGGQICLDSQLIGVALDGSLIKNNDTWRFRTFSESTLLGYARDGLPIYGPGVDDSLLDACGGYVGPAGYQYHLRPNEPFIIGCYSGMPAPFLP
ncbi:hypothetical protein N9L26_02425 [Candidatus Pacebacteria bacterium]|nr:hypothetical protein [Candidatus Paceibacterota bacterium]